MLTDTEAELRERLVRMETQVANMALALQNMATELKILSEKVASEKLDETERNAYQRGALRIGYAVLSAALAGLLVGGASLITAEHHRVLRVARTLADLDGVSDIGRLHLAEALSYRATGDGGGHAAPVN